MGGSLTTDTSPLTPRGEAGGEPLSARDHEDAPRGFAMGSTDSVVSALRSEGGLVLAGGPAGKSPSPGDFPHRGTGRGSGHTGRTGWREEGVRGRHFVPLRPSRLLARRSSSD